VVCDEHGIGGSGAYCGENDANLDRANAFYHGAFGGKRDEYNLGNHTREQKLGQKPLQKG
jgi:hypothetical protein